jgi:hypothetical protein
LEYNFDFDKVRVGFPKIDSHLGISSKLEEVSKNFLRGGLCKYYFCKVQRVLVKLPMCGLEYILILIKYFTYVWAGVHFNFDKV